MLRTAIFFGQNDITALLEVRPARTRQLRWAASSCVFWLRPVDCLRRVREGQRQYRHALCLAVPLGPYAPHTPHSLQANDATLKQKLGLVVEMEVRWRGCNLVWVAPTRGTMQEA